MMSPSECFCNFYVGFYSLENPCLLICNFLLISFVRNKFQCMCSVNRQEFQLNKPFFMIIFLISSCNDIWNIISVIAKVASDSFRSVIFILHLFFRAVRTGFFCHSLINYCLPNNPSQFSICTTRCGIPISKRVICLTRIYNILQSASKKRNCVVIWILLQPIIMI